MFYHFKKEILPLTFFFKHHEMLTTRFPYRVLYVDTDQMGVMYHGNYTRLYEIGRSEMVRDLGLPYNELEKAGVSMPVVSVNARYLRSAFYDELLTIETSVKELPGARIVFLHRVYNPKEELIHSAEVTLVFLNMETNRPCRPPQMLVDLMKEYF